MFRKFTTIVYLCVFVDNSDWQLGGPFDDTQNASDAAPVNTAQMYGVQKWNVLLNENGWKLDERERLLVAHRTVDHNQAGMAIHGGFWV